MLRMTPSLSAVGLTAGTFSDVAKISQGVAPYYVVSSATPVASARILSDGTLRLFGTLPGTATVTVQDSSVNQQSIPLDVTVQALPPLYIFPALTEVTMVPGSKFYFTVSGGSPPYSVGSGGLVSVICNPETPPLPVNGYCLSHAYVATAGGSTGTDTITITDQYRFGTPDDTISIKVTIQAPTVALKVSPSALPGAPGTTGELMITGGVPPYRVSASNPSVATAGQPTADGRVTVNLIDATLSGSATSVITVVDAVGNSVSSTVTVTTPKEPTPTTPTTPSTPPVTTLMVTPATRPLGAVGTQVTFDIVGGTGPYTASVLNILDYATQLQTAIAGSTLYVVHIGTCPVNETIPITVQDSGNQSFTVNVQLNC